MANNEAQFRAELLKDARQLGCHAEPNVSDFDIGRPDIFIKNPQYEHTLWAELKFIRSRGRKINLSAQQRNWGRKHMEVGGLWCWAVCVKPRDRYWELWVGTSASAQHIEDGMLIHTKKAGEHWNVNKLFDAITI